MYKLTLFLVLFASISVPIGCDRNFDSEKTKDMEFLNHSLLWKDLTSSSSRNAISWAISYLSRKKPATANEKQDIVKNARPEKTINDLMEKSIEYQDWLKDQEIEVTVKLIEDYPSFRLSRSPYYPD